MKQETTKIRTSGRLDRNMKELVGVLNTFPGIKTVSSCGGHIKLSGKDPARDPAKKGEFWVQFITPVDDSDGDVKKSISIIKSVIGEYDGKIDLTKDLFPAIHGQQFWGIDGKGVAPRVLAYRLYGELKRREV